MKIIIKIALLCGLVVSHCSRGAMEELSEEAETVYKGMSTGGGAMVFEEEEENNEKPELDRASSLISLSQDQLLIQAAKAGNLKDVIASLKTGSDNQKEAQADQEDDQGYTALLRAAQGGFPEIVELLLGRSEADINAQVNGKNSLELALAGFNEVTSQASKQNYLKVIGLLLHGGINVPEEFQAQAPILLDAAVTYFINAANDEQKQAYLDVIMTLQRMVPRLMSPEFAKNSGALLEGAAHYVTRPGQATFNLRLQQEKYLNFIANLVQSGIQTLAFKKLAPVVFEVVADNFIQSGIDPDQQRIDRDLMKSLLLLEVPITEKVKDMAGKIIEKAVDYFIAENKVQQNNYRNLIATLLNNATVRNAVLNNSAAIKALNKAFGFVEANKLLLLREFTPEKSKK